MKAAPFEYSRAGDIDEACALLAADDGARAIAGGQTLVPMMAMRLARPTRLVDIARIAALSHITKEDGAIAIGAATRQCTIERNALIASELPLMARALPHIGHAATRARGTLGGSIAHADPAAELPLVAVTLQATVHYREGKENGEMAGGRVLHRPHHHRVADGRAAHRRALSGVARQSRRRFSRGECAAQRFRLCVGGGAGRVGRRRQSKTHRYRHRRGERCSGAA